MFDCGETDISTDFKAQAHITRNKLFSDVGRLCLIHILHTVMQYALLLYTHPKT
jgi:hypothetical protein